MKVKVLYFAQAREKVGSPEEIFDFEGNRLEHFVKSIERKHPELKSILKSCSFSVNMEISKLNKEIKENDTIAILPPVAGG